MERHAPSGERLEVHDSVHVAEEHRMLREQVRRFVEREVLPHADDWEAAGKIPREVFRKLGDLGVLGMRCPVEHGGSGLDALASVVLAEELGRSTYSGFAVAVLVHTDMASPHLINAGRADQLARYVPGIVSGEIVTAVAVTEPDAGSDVQGIRTRARREGNGWVLNGSKVYITNGVHANLLFVAARTDPEAKPSRGTSMFIVERDTPGFRVARQLDKMGWLCSDTAELVFEDARLPADALLGEENRGFYEIMKNFQNERLVAAAANVGGGEQGDRADAPVHPKERKAFGGTLWDRQAIRQRLAALSARVRGAAPPRLPHRVARYAGGGLRGAGVDGQGLGGRARQRRGPSPASASTAPSGSCARARSSAWPATCVLTSSGAGRPR